MAGEDFHALMIIVNMKLIAKNASRNVLLNTKNYHFK
jgi:hypothetical protein